MQIGTFKIPEIRLDIILSGTLQKIYNSVKTDEIQSKDLSELLGYKYGTERGLFQKINSMLAYGVLEGRGVYKITKLGENLLFPEPDKEQQLRSQAIMNVELWKELFKKNGKALPKEGLWVQLKNIAEVDPATAKKLENKISNWYLEDIAHVPDNIIFPKEQDEDNNQQSDTMRSHSLQNTQVTQQIQIPKLNNMNNVEVLSFDKYQVVLPKGDLKKEWNKLKQYMDIKLQDYEYEKPKSTDDEKYDNNIKNAKCPQCGLVAHDLDEIQKSFGFRNHNGKQVVQSWCVDCRNSSKMVN